jgi:hypothetical protein
MMKKLLVLAILIGLGVLAYGRFFSAKARAASKIESLCDSSISVKDMSDLKDALGDHYDAAIDCVSDATSCPEVVGCVLGAAGDRLDDATKDVERGLKNYGKHK